MSIQTMNPAALRKAGLAAISKELGPLGMVRFLQQFETGSGNYTKERRQWLEKMEIKDIVSEIKRRRARH